jgi:hypothetical protein
MPVLIADRPLVLAQLKDRLHFIIVKLAVESPVKDALLAQASLWIHSSRSRAAL